MEPPHDANCVPIDLRACDCKVESCDQMIDELGLKGAIEEFAKARKQFLSLFKDCEDAPQPMTGEEWNQLISSPLEEEEEDFFGDLNSEDFDALEGLEEEDEEDEEGAEEEPAAKKQKTEE